MFYLYIKQHNKTRLKYLGYTKHNPYQYNGSGKYWKNHIKIHGTDISTYIVGTYNTPEELKEAGTFYSKVWNIVESDQWANLRIEEGSGGAGPYMFDKRNPNNLPHVKERMYKNNPMKLPNIAAKNANLRSKNYILISPQNKVFKIRNLSKFSREYNLSQAALTHVAKGKYNHHKGWLCNYGS